MQLGRHLSQAGCIHAKMQAEDVTPAPLCGPLSKGRNAARCALMTARLHIFQIMSKVIGH
jgi:hypothetical protein